MNMAYQEINRHWRSLNNSLDIAQQHNLRFNFDRTLEQGCIQELMEHIHKLEDTARVKSNFRAEKSSSRAEKSSPRVKERARRSKRITVKISSGRPASNTPSSPDSPNSEEGIAPLIQKRKGQAL